MNSKQVLDTKVTEHYFEFANRKYFKENAHNVQLGSYGEKKDPIGARAYLDVQAKVKAEALEGKVKFNTTTEIDWSETKSGNITVNGQVPFFGLNGKAALTTTYEKAKTARLKLMNFEIDEGPLKKMLNQEADGARKFLADEGNDGRICSGIWVWAEGEVAEHFASSTTFTASVDKGATSVSVTATGGKHGSQTVTITPGTTYAYKLHKVKDWNKGKTVIENLEADWKGNG